MAKYVYPGQYINISVNGQEYPPKQSPRVYEYGGNWYFSDEADQENGPFGNWVTAEREFAYYCKFQLNGEPIPEANNILKELVNNEKR